MSKASSPQKTASASTAPASSSISTSGPGPRRFRGDVPAFNPSGMGPYSPQMHTYPPQHPSSSPAYPAHPQYFPSQPSYMYGGMPYYSVPVNYPDYSMYSQYPYYMANPYSAPQAYMGMNGMPAMANGNGYAGRKKHTKGHYQNGNGSASTLNGSSGTSQYATAPGSSSNDPAAASDAHTPKHQSSSSPQASHSPEITTPTAAPKQESPKVLKTPAQTEPTAKSASSSVEPVIEPVTEPAAEPVAEPAATPEADATDKAVAEPAAREPAAAEKAVSAKSLPLLFNITTEELAAEKSANALPTSGSIALEESRLRLLLNSTSSFLTDKSRSYKVIDHNTGTTHTTNAIPEFLTANTNDNDSNDSNAPKTSLNWADLLQNSGKSTKKKPANAAASTFAKAAQAEPVSSVETSDEPRSLGLLMMTVLYDPSFKLDSLASFPLRPRGLTNSGNICYMNAVLQCLIFCQPFNKILKLVEDKSTAHLGSESPTPLIDATIQFVNDFMNVAPSATPNGSTTNSDGVVVGRPLSPENLYMKLIKNPKFQHLKWGQQEDAEEFLGYLLDGLHEEFVKSEAAVSPEKMAELAETYSKKLTPPLAADLKARMKAAVKAVRSSGSKPQVDEETEDESEDSGWSEVGSRRTVSKKRVAEVEPSPITKLFGGRFRSVLTVPKSKESHSITVDPFRCISVDVSQEGVNTIEDALSKFNDIEKIPYKLDDNKEVTARKQTFIDELPEILILQLKRFAFQHKERDPSPDHDGRAHLSGLGSIEKVLKNVGYGLELSFSPECVSAAARSAAGNNYSLIGVIYHHGRNAEGGHYTCDVIKEKGKWLRIDDNSVEVIGQDAVTQKPDARDKSAYILLYERKRN